ncbi:MAG: hemerythrin domain-containing protein [Blastocatellia bacterium]
MNELKKVNTLHLLNQPMIADFSDPLQLLVHCHERIEQQLRLLERAGEVLRTGITADLAAAFAAIDRASAHFAGPGVKHTADEEESLFPRLRERADQSISDALATLDELEPQHRTAETLHAEFDRLIAELPRHQVPTAMALNQYDALVEQLAALYRPHIRLENELIFPAAARVLTPAELQQIGAAMRARRSDLLRPSPDTLSGAQH